MAEIILTGLTKTYADGTAAVKDLTLTVGDGEFLVLVGPSGCGKSTVLRCVAGLEQPSAGTVALDGRVINDLPPQVRDLAMVFQSYALYPHLSVYDNLAFGLKMRRLKKEEIRRRVAAVARKLGLTALLTKRPRDLSGGERQRVALGRAMVRQPRAFLMDEPLSNLDAALRVKMRTELLALQRELQATVLYVTHDQTEAMTMGDRVAVLHQGRLRQVASPQELYDYPANRFVAGFIGSPAMNFITARIGRQPGGLALEMGGQTMALPPNFLAGRPALGQYLEQPVTLGIRPEHIALAFQAEEAGAPEVIRVRVEMVETLGPVNYVHFSLPDPLTPENGKISWTAALDPAVRTAPDWEMDLSFNPHRLHLFDRDSGQAIRLTA
jgi:multiple sugar transport system ATP-binding protein